MPAPLALRSLPLLNTLTHKELQAVLPHLQTRLAAPGTLLLGAGQVQVPLIVVRQGRITLSRPAESGRTLLIDRREGPCVAGETDVLAPRPALLQVRAETAVHYLALPAEAMALLCTQAPACMEKIVCEVGAMMRHQASTLEARLKARSLMPRPLRADATRQARRAACASAAIRPREL
jgi:CRP-like cAMP-binding protein